VKKPEFLVMAIGQTTPIAGAHNTIIVTFEVNVEVSGDEGQTIQVSGLDNARSEEEMRLENPVDSYYDSYQFFAYKGRPRYALFQNGNVVCTMATGFTFLTNRQYTFAFSLVNPDQGQDSPDMYLSGRGTATFLPTGAPWSQMCLFLTF
jgi:hypothetical protein